MATDAQRESTRKCMQRKRERLRRAGLCAICGRCPAAPKRMNCEECLKVKCQQRKAYKLRRGDAYRLERNARERESYRESMRPTVRLEGSARVERLMQLAERLRR